MWHIFCVSFYCIQMVLLIEYPFGLACFVYVVCFRIFTLLNIFLDLLAMCMSSVPGSSLTRISFCFWVITLLKYHFGLVCYVYVFCLFPDRPLLEYPFGLACYVYVFCFRVVPLLEYPFGHDASTSDNISVWN